MIVDVTSNEKAVHGDFYNSIELKFDYQSIHALN
jgi:hypothetical protein